MRVVSFHNTAITLHRRRIHHTTDDQGAHIRYYTYETKYIYIRYTHMHLTIPYETAYYAIHVNPHDAL
jgi:hypothetical protein